MADRPRLGPRLIKFNPKNIPRTGTSKIYLRNGRTEGGKERISDYL